MEHMTFIQILLMQIYNDYGTIQRKKRGKQQLTFV